MSANQTELTLKITTDQAQAVQALIDLGNRLETLGQELDTAKAKSATLENAWEAVGQQVDHLGLQIALGKKQLQDMAANGIGKTHADYIDLKREIQDNEAALRRLMPSLNQAEREYRAQAAAVSNLDAKIKQNTATYQANSAALQKAGVNVDHLQGEFARLTRQADQSAQALKAQAAASKTAGDGAAGLGTSIRNTIASFAAMATAYVGFQQLKQSIMSVIETGGKFESLNVSLQTLMGSMEGAQQASDWIVKFAKDTPVSLDGVSQAFIRLKAYGLDPMDGTLQSLVDQNAKMSGTQEDLMGMIMGVGQAWTKQKLQAEEANQLIERGVPVWEILSKVMGKSTAEVMALSKAGAIGQREIRLLIEEIGKSSAGAAKAQMSTWGGLISTLSDNWTQFLNTIAKSGSLDWFKDKVKEINQAFTDMAKSGELQAKAHELSQAIKGVAIAADAGASLVAAGWKKIQIAGTYIAEYVVTVEAGWERLKLGPKIDFSKINADFAKQREEILHGSEAIKQQAAAANELAESHAKIAGSLIQGTDALRGFTKESDRLDGFAKAIKASADDTKGAATAWKDYLETVKSSDLAALIAEATSKMAEFGPIIGQNSEKMKEWQSVIDTALGESFKRAGVDAEAALTGISTAVSKSIKDILALQQSMTASGMEAQKAAKITLDALTGMIPKAKTTGDIAAIRTELQTLGQGAQAATPLFNGLTSAYQQLDEQQKKLAPGSAALTLALNQSRASAEALAAKFKDGTATAADFAKANADAASAAQMLAAAEGQAAAATGSLSNAQIAANSVMAEKAAHNTTVRATNAQMAEEEQKQASDKHASMARASDDGVQYTATQSLMTQALWKFGEAGIAAIKSTNEQSLSFDTWFQQMERWRIMAEQQIESAAFWEQGLQRATLSGEGLSAWIAGASRDFDKLGKENLSGLNAALDAAKAKLESLRQAADDTRRSLQDELDQIEGNQASIEQRRYESRIAELQDKIKQASGDQSMLADLNASLALAQQIHSANQKKLADEAKSREASAQPNKSTQTPQASTPMVRYEIIVNNKKHTVDATASSSVDMFAAFDSLKKAQNLQ
jgi:tape measure domain-containing protein